MLGICENSAESDQKPSECVPFSVFTAPQFPCIKKPIPNMQQGSCCTWSCSRQQQILCQLREQDLGTRSPRPAPKLLISEQKTWRIRSVSV